MHHHFGFEALHTQLHKNENEDEKEEEYLDDYALNIFDEISTRVGVLHFCLTNEVCSVVGREEREREFSLVFVISHVYEN